MFTLFFATREWKIRVSCVKESQNIIFEESMSFKHTIVDLGADGTICFGIAWAVAEFHDQVDWILLELL